MLPCTEYGSGTIALVMMPFLGGTQREWDEVVERLSLSFRCITLDLPGFGAANKLAGYSVEQMSDAVIETLSSLRLSRYVLIGHSMAGKVSAIVARRLGGTASKVQPPVGLILVAPSPPSPEPMPQSKREEMLLFFLSERSERYDAEKYVGENLYVEISQNALNRTVDGVLSMNHNAWTAWLESGSKEDWSEYVGALDLPSLVVAGSEDKALGPQAQRDLTLPHFPSGKLEVLHCSHLIPLEQPRELGTLISRFVTALSNFEEYQHLIESPRVSPQTRKVLLERAVPDDPAYEPKTMSHDQMRTLRSVIDRVVPQSGPARIDIAARLDRQLASGTGDGWRYAVLPPDAEACTTGLSILDALSRDLHGTSFAMLADPDKDSLLAAVTEGSHESPRLNLKRWFEDLRGNAVRIYISHPQTLAAMGYSGIADDPNGFVQIGIGQTEAWEPETK